MASRMIARQVAGILPPGGAMPRSSVLASRRIVELPDDRQSSLTAEQVAAGFSLLRAVEQRDHFLPPIANDRRPFCRHGVRYGLRSG